MSTYTRFELGRFLLRLSSSAESLELNNMAAWLGFSTQSLSMPPPKVLWDGKHPIGGALKTPILRAPNAYNPFSQRKKSNKSKLQALTEIRIIWF